MEKRKIKENVKVLYYTVDSGDGKEIDVPADQIQVLVDDVVHGKEHLKFNLIEGVSEKSKA